MNHGVGKVRSSGFEGGLSLVEVLTAASIISLAMLAIASMFDIGSSLVLDSGTVSQALASAQGKVEELKNKPFPPSGGSEAISVGSNSYTRSWTVSLSGSSPNRLATVTVTVTWSGRKPGSTQLMIMITEP